jgi:hypothetical protein
MTEHGPTVRPAELDVSIIVPAYNEVEYLRQEVDHVRASMNTSEHRHEIVIVDYESSDGSGDPGLTIPDVRGIRLLDFDRTTNTLPILFPAFQVFTIGLLADRVARVSRNRDEVPVAFETNETDTP